MHPGSRIVLCCTYNGVLQSVFNIIQTILVREHSCSFLSLHIDLEDLCNILNYVGLNSREILLFSGACTMEEGNLRGAFLLIAPFLQVLCTGAEERLLDCGFPENFGIDYVYTPRSYDDYLGYNWPAASHADPAPAPAENAPSPSNGLPRVGCNRGNRELFSVICRRFEITGMEAMC